MSDYPDDQWTREVCMIGQGHDCCRYLCMSARGWSCEKHGSLRALLDQRVAEKTIAARGDNCLGKDSRLNGEEIPEVGEEWFKKAELHVGGRRIGNTLADQIEKRIYSVINALNKPLTPDLIRRIALEIADLVTNGKMS